MFACGWIRSAVAPIPQITSLQTRKLQVTETAASSGTPGLLRIGRPRVSENLGRTPQRQGRDGMSLLEGTIDSRNNPLAVVEDIATHHDWSFEWSGDDEVTIVSKGDWTDYQLSFTWMNEIEALHLACAFDMKIPTARRAEVQRLIA
eukprot:gene22367-42639_t